MVLSLIMVSTTILLTFIVLSFVQKLENFRKKSKPSFNVDHAHRPQQPVVAYKH